MAILLEGPSTFEKGIILLILAVFFMVLNSSVQSVCFFLCAFAKDGYIVE